MSNGETRDLLSKAIHSFINRTPFFRIDDDGEMWLMWIKPKSIVTQISFTFKNSEGFLEDFTFKVEAFVSGDCQLLFKGIAPEEVLGFKNDLETSVKKELAAAKKILRFKDREVRRLVEMDWFRVFDHLEEKGIDLKTDLDKAYVQLLHIKRNKPEIYKAMTALFKEIDYKIENILSERKIA